MKKNTKYLYGKFSNLSSFISNGRPLWFRDISSLNMLENRLICDDERSKRFCVDSQRITSFSINGRQFKLAPESQFTISQPTRPCHVLCLSNDGNKAELYDRFNADICIELNVELMIKMIKESNEHFKLDVVGKDVVYFKPGRAPENLDPCELVFRKEYDKYAIENEFRIAIFWPNDHDSLVMTDGDKYINVFGSEASHNDHISLNFEDINLNDLIVDVKSVEGSSVCL